MLLNNRCYEKPEFTNEIPQENAMMGVGYQSMCPPIYECPVERVCHRENVIEVPHIIPINTRIINHQIYHHTYSPCFTACEETEISNVYDNHCGY